MKIDISDTELTFIDAFPDLCHTSHEFCDYKLTIPIAVYKRLVNACMDLSIDPDLFIKNSLLFSLHLHDKKGYNDL